LNTKQERVRVLAEKNGAHLRGPIRELGAAGLKGDRQIGNPLPRHAGEFEAGLPNALPAMRELDVRDDPQDVRLVPREVVPRLLEGRGEEQLRTGPGSHDLVRGVHPLADQALRLPDDLRVELGEERRVVADVVLDDQDDAHPHRRRVVCDVPEILDVLDDREKDAGVPLPEEETVQIGEVVLPFEVLPFIVVVRHGDDGDVESRALHLPRKRRGVHVGGAKGGDDEVEPPFGRRQHQRFGAARNVGQPRHVRQGEIQELAGDQFVQPSVFLQREGVVETGDEQDVLDPKRHQVLERLERIAYFREGGRLVGRAHR